MLKDLIIIFGAPGLFIGAIVLGYNVFYAEAPGLWLGLAALGGAAAYFAFRRAFAAMCLYGAGLLLFLVVYPKLEGLESYSREGRLRGRLGAMRQEILTSRAREGRWPQDGAGLSAAGFELRSGHSTPAAVETFVFPRENYIWPPDRLDEKLNVAVLEAGAPQEETLRWYWGNDVAAPMFLYPGGEFGYRVTRDKDGSMVSSGTVKAPVPPGFVPDSGVLVYDPSTGNLFVNCAHRMKQKSNMRWWSI